MTIGTPNIGCFDVSVQTTTTGTTTMMSITGVGITEPAVVVFRW